MVGGRKIKVIGGNNARYFRRRAAKTKAKYRIR
jgi:hypothetical protein